MLETFVIALGISVALIAIIALPILAVAWVCANVSEFGGVALFCMLAFISVCFVVHDAKNKATQTEITRRNDECR